MLPLRNGVVAHNMTDVDRRRLSKAPLALVAFQANFSDLDRRLLGKEVVTFRDSLKHGDYGELAQVRRNQITLQVGALGATQASDSSTSNGWRFTTKDQAWSVTLFQDSLLLEAHAQAYGDWASGFRPRLEAAITALDTIFHPELEMRLGLRYINALSDERAIAPTFWRDRIHSAFLGPLADSRLGDHFRGSNLRANFEFEGLQGAVSVAYQQDAVYQGNTAVIFDADVFSQDPQEFSTPRIMSEADRLNTQALYIFQSMVTASQLEEFR